MSFSLAKSVTQRSNKDRNEQSWSFLYIETWEFLRPIHVSKSFHFLSRASGFLLHCLLHSFFLISEESQGVLPFYLGSQTSLHLHRTLMGFKLNACKTHQLDLVQWHNGKQGQWLVNTPPPPPPPRGTRHQDTSPIPFKGSYHSEQYLAIPTKLLWSEQFSLQEKFPSNKTCTLENVAVPPSHPTQMALSTFPKQYEHSQTSCSEETSLLTHVDYSTLDGPAKNTLLLL